MRLLPGCAQALRRVNERKHPIFVVTNQSAVARGIISLAFAEESGRHLRKLLAQDGAQIHEYYFCPYHPEGQVPFRACPVDRKPSPGMLLRASREHGVQLRGAYMIGDKQTDLRVGAELGVVPLLVRSGYGRETESQLDPSFYRRGGRVFDDLPAALAWILSVQGTPCV